MRTGYLFVLGAVALATACGTADDGRGAPDGQQGTRGAELIKQTDVGGGTGPTSGGGGKGGSAGAAGKGGAAGKAGSAGAGAKGGAPATSITNVSAGVLAPIRETAPSPVAPCAPIAYQLNVYPQTCLQVAQTTPMGTLLVSPAFPTAAPAVRDHVCFATVLPAAPACQEPNFQFPDDASVLLQRRSDCAAGFASCGWAAAQATPKTPAQIPPTVPLLPCDDPPHCGIPQGTVGQCDVCGIVAQDQLYVINPSPLLDTSVGYAEVTRTNGTKAYFQLSNNGSGIYSAPIGAGYVEGRSYVWWPTAHGQPPAGFPQ